MKPLCRRHGKALAGEAGSSMIPPLSLASPETGLEA